MSRTVIISSNGNPDYEFYIPLAQWAWEKIGWKVAVLKPFSLPPYREQTVTQVMRLYAAILKRFEPDDLLMTSDADMIPLSNYWSPTVDDITVYGHDLTGYQHVPICYIAMTKQKWGEVMHLNSPDIHKLMERDLKKSKALSATFCEWWGVDQDIITDRLSKHTVKRIDRGVDTSTGYPTGRFDRTGMKYPQGQLIDLHGPRKGWEQADKIKDVIHKAYGTTPDWFDRHCQEYQCKVEVLKA